ncbi:MAG: hypothetical protein KGL39_40245 [Patescibacteria group bacterium]|nr:hypothetical protein [Patescibacteria group bacterium]
MLKRLYCLVFLAMAGCGGGATTDKPSEPVKPQAEVQPVKIPPVVVATPVKTLPIQDDIIWVTDSRDGLKIRMTEVRGSPPKAGKLYLFQGERVYLRRLIENGERKWFIFPEIPMTKPIRPNGWSKEGWAHMEVAELFPVEEKP